MQTQPIQLLRKAVIDTITAKEISHLSFLRLLRMYLKTAQNNPDLKDEYIQKALDAIIEELLNE